MFPASLSFYISTLITLDTLLSLYISGDYERGIALLLLGVESFDNLLHLAVAKRESLKTPHHLSPIISLELIDHSSHYLRLTKHTLNTETVRL